MAHAPNPCSKITPEELMGLTGKLNNGYLFPEYGNGITSYILFKESYDALMDLESMGVRIRDTEDEFIGAEFRDEETKLLFAYDYDNKYTIRVNGGTDIKVALYKEMKRLGVKIYDRVMCTCLLTEGGEQGGRVIGATGIHTRTGEFYIFKSKAVILSTGTVSGMWVFSHEMAGAAFTHISDPNNSGEGASMAWLAGVEMTLMERSAPAAGGFAYLAYGTGNAHNTWYACNIVDANGKEVPWVDRDGRVLKTVAERYHPAPGQRTFMHGVPSYELKNPSLIPDLPERIAKGEYVLPLYADLPGMPEHERRVIWGLMMYHEGKCRIIHETYQKAGFDPDKDMLQVNIMPPDRYFFYPWWSGYGPRQWRDGGMVPGSGPVFDWDLRTNLEGLYVAGQATYAGADHAVAATTGRYAGRKAAAYVHTAMEPQVNREQIDREKERVYAPVKRTEGIGWKELRAGLCRIMQDYCGEYKNEEILRMGLEWLRSVRESEASQVYARNPHELMRTLECLSRITVGEIIMNASLNRKASSRFLDFKRMDYPEMDPAEWNKLVTMKLENDEIKTGERPLDYYVLSPDAPGFEDNYRNHSEL
jgi:succinate dehydrogenase/fumarate reductase flavoprotein subunit